MFSQITNISGSSRNNEYLKLSSISHWASISQNWPIQVLVAGIFIGMWLLNEWENIIIGVVAKPITKFFFLFRFHFRQKLLHLKRRSYFLLKEKTIKLNCRCIRICAPGCVTWTSLKSMPVTIKQTGPELIRGFEMKIFFWNGILFSRLNVSFIYFLA